MNNDELQVAINSCLDYLLYAKNHNDGVFDEVLSHLSKLLEEQQKRMGL